MAKCAACGIETTRRLCNFCRRTVELVRARRCVFCKVPVVDGEVTGTWGQCGECRDRRAAKPRNYRVSSGTRWVLKQASAARYADARRAA